jgi:transposase
MRVEGSPTSEVFVARAYSQDLRDRVIGATEAGMPARHAAARFGIGLATAIVWARRARETGERTARRQGQPRRSMLDAHGDYLGQLIAATCDITLAEMQAKLLEERGVKCSIGTLWKFLDQRKLTVKKSRRTPRNRIART